MGEIFWILLLVVAVQPILKQKLLEASRNRVLKTLQEERASRVISLVHRQETMSFLGIPVFRYIDIDDSERLLRAIQSTDDDAGRQVPSGLAAARRGEEAGGGDR